MAGGAARRKCVKLAPAHCKKGPCMRCADYEPMAGSGLVGGARKCVARAPADCKKGPCHRCSKYEGSGYGGARGAGRGGMLVGGKRRGASAYIAFLKRYAAEHGLPYQLAMLEVSKSGAWEKEKEMMAGGARRRAPAAPRASAMKARSKSRAR